VKAESTAEKNEGAQQERTPCKGGKVPQEEEEGGRKVMKSYFQLFWLRWDVAS